MPAERHGAGKKDTEDKEEKCFAPRRRAIRLGGTNTMVKEDREPHTITNCMHCYSLR